MPPQSAVYYYFALWRDDGTAETIHDLLRWQVREARKRREDPTAVVLDTQTVRSSTNAPKDTTRLDAGNKSPGRKRGIATDVLGVIIAVVVAAASVHDNAIGIELLDKVAASAPGVAKALVDAGFKNAVVEHGAALGIDVEIVHRDPGVRGFTPEPKRWIVEQTYGTLIQHRRLARDYEAKPAGSVAMIHWTMTDIMLRRPTHTAPPRPGATRPPDGRPPHRAGASMQDLLEKIETRQRLVRETIEHLREQITQLTEQLAAEQTLERADHPRDRARAGRRGRSPAARATPTRLPRDPDRLRKGRRRAPREGRLLGAGHRDRVPSHRRHPGEAETPGWTTPGSGKPVTGERWTQPSPTSWLASRYPSPTGRAWAAPSSGARNRTPLPRCPHRARPVGTSTTCTSFAADRGARFPLGTYLLFHG